MNQSFVQMKKTIRLTFVLSIPVFLLACNNGNNTNKGDKNQVGTYKVLELKPSSTTLFTEYPASIEGQENIEIRPKIDGYIEKIFVDEGTVVKKGQPLFKINAPQYEQEVITSNANIQRAMADVSAAKLAVNKVKPLVDQDIVSKFELESAQYNLQAKEAALAQAKASLFNAKTNLAYTLVNSPVDGVVGSIPFRLGSLVSSNTAQPLTTVSSIGNVYAYFAMNEKELLNFAKDGNQSFIDKIAKLPPVSLLLSDGTLYEKEGRIQTVNGLINTATGAANVRASFPNTNGLIRSGSSATIRIPTKIENKIIIPQSATFELQDKHMVVLVGADQKTSSVAVSVMAKTAGNFYIVESGLKAGDKIVLEGASLLKSGTLIKPEMVSASQILN